MNATDTIHEEDEEGAGVGNREQALESAVQSRQDHPRDMMRSKGNGGGVEGDECSHGGDTRKEAAEGCSESEDEDSDEEDIRRRRCIRCVLPVV